MNEEQDERSFVVECETPQGWKIMAIPIRLLARDPARVIRILKGAGVEVAPGMDAYAIEYLTTECRCLEGQAQ